MYTAFFFSFLFFFFSILGLHLSCMSLSLCPNLHVCFSLLVFFPNLPSVLSGVPLSHLRTRSTASLTCLEQQIHARGTGCGLSR